MINMKFYLIVGAVVAGIMASMYFVVKSQISARVDAEIMATQEKTRADLKQAEVIRLSMQINEERKRQIKLAQELQKARDSEALATEVVEDRERLNRITQAKPGLMERQARKATKNVWSDIEDDSRE